MKDFFFSKVDNFRYERKFYIENSRRSQVELFIKLHPALFREIYHKRTVNNIYFDFFNLQYYYDNINGIERRLKVRIRWYDRMFGFIDNPVLELKLKNNLHIGKISYPLKSFSLDSDFSIERIREVFRESSLHDVLNLHLVELNFSLLNSYDRRYFLSADGKYRITVDDNIKVYKLSDYANNFLQKTVDFYNIIVEIKYNKLQGEFVDNITNYFPFRMTRSSKYVTGIEGLAL